MTNERLSIDGTAALSVSDKLHILEQLLATPLEKIADIAQNSALPYFYQGCAKMLIDNNLVEYFSLIQICRDIANMDKEQRKDTDFL